MAFFQKPPPVHQRFPVHTCLCTAKGSLTMFALQFCPPSASLQASNTTTFPFQMPQCCSVYSPWAANVNQHWKVFIWFGRKHVVRIGPRVLAFCWAFDLQSLANFGPAHSTAACLLDVAESWVFPFWTLNIELLLHSLSIKGLSHCLNGPLNVVWGDIDLIRQGFWHLLWA